MLRRDCSFDLVPTGHPGIDSRMWRRRSDPTGASSPDLMWGSESGHLSRKCRTRSIDRRFRATSGCLRTAMMEVWPEALRSEPGRRWKGQLRRCLPTGDATACRPSGQPPEVALLCLRLWMPVDRPSRRDPRSAHFRSSRPYAGIRLDRNLHRCRPGTQFRSTLTTGFCLAYPARNRQNTILQRVAYLKAKSTYVPRARMRSALFST